MTSLLGERALGQGNQTSGMLLFSCQLLCWFCALLLEFAHLLQVGLFQHSSLLGFDDSVASLRTSGSCAPRCEKESVVESWVAVDFADTHFLGSVLTFCLTGFWAIALL
jgi:hypothetical protein